MCISKGEILLTNAAVFGRLSIGQTYGNVWTQSKKSTCGREYSSIYDGSAAVYYALQLFCLAEKKTIIRMRIGDVLHL